jgi:hypothetical protein
MGFFGTSDAGPPCAVGLPQNEPQALRPHGAFESVASFRSSGRAAGLSGDEEPPGRAYFRLNSRKRIKFDRSCAAPLERIAGPALSGGARGRSTGRGCKRPANALNYGRVRRSPSVQAPLLVTLYWVKPDLEMRAHLAAGFSLVAILSLIVPAQSDEVPNLDVAQLCRGVASQAKDPMAGGEPTVTFERCMNGEQAERKELEKVWSTFLADDKKHCVAESRMGGESSYTELITCLEMAVAVRSYRTDERQKDASMAQRRPPVTKARHTRSWSKHVMSRHRHRHRWWCPPRRWFP